MAKIDCSITENYLKEKARMTKPGYGNSCNINCRNCPLSDYNNLANIGCSKFEKFYPKEAISVIQKWSDEHQREIDWMKVPMNTPVYVRDNELSDWRLRHFVCYLPNASHRYECFDSGRPQEGAAGTSNWKHCKLADEVDPTPYYKENI